MKKIWITIGILLVAALVIILIVTQTKKEAEVIKKSEVAKITLAVNKTIYSGPIYVALAKDYWRQEGLDVTVKEFAAGRFCLEAVLSGAAHLGTVADIPLSLAGINKQKFYIIATMTWGDGDVKIIARKDRGISSPLDLKGKKVAILFGTSSEFYLKQFLQKYSVNSKELKIINMRLEDMPTALLRGDVDAVTLWEPFGYYVKKELGDKAVIFIERGIYNVPHNIVATQEFVTKNQKTINAILRALLRTEEFIKENHAEAVQIIAKATDLDPEVMEEIWGNYRFGPTLDKILIEQLNAVAQWAIESGTAPREAEIPDYRNFIYLDALKELKPRNVNLQ